MSRRPFTAAEKDLMQRLAESGQGAAAIARALLAAGHASRTKTTVTSSAQFQRGRKVFVAAEARRHADEAAAARAAATARAEIRHLQHRDFPGVSLPALAMLASHPNYARSGSAL